MLIIGVVFLEANSSEFFPINQGVARGCVLSLTLFSIYIYIIMYGKLSPRLQEWLTLIQVEQVIISNS